MFGWNSSQELARLRNEIESLKEQGLAHAQRADSLAAQNEQLQSGIREITQRVRLFDGYSGPRFQDSGLSCALS